MKKRTAQKPKLSARPLSSALPDKKSAAGIKKDPATLGSLNRPIGLSAKVIRESAGRFNMFPRKPAQMRVAVTKEAIM